MPGPLSGIKIVEMGGIGPGPFCAMLLADLGAEVIRIERAGFTSPVEPRLDVTRRSRPCVAIDLKQKAGVAAVLALVRRADALIEGFRPGVMERLGLGPDPCLAANPRLVYGRMTGWGQDGPLALAAGHDINYIALTGALHAIGQNGGAPVPPLNLVGDFGGGALYLAFGVAAALVEAGRSGKGQVVDAAMVDGAASLMTMFYGLFAGKSWTEERGANLLDGGAPWYGVYETKDGKHIALGSLEEKFWQELLERVGIKPEELPSRRDAKDWDRFRERFTALFKTRTRDEWCAVLEGSDACFAPVLSLSEAAGHPHNRERATFVEIEGVTQPAPAPRFSRTPGAIRPQSEAAKGGLGQALVGWALPAAELEALAKVAVLQQ